MAILMPTVDCKPTDPNVFLTPLQSSLSTGYFPSNFFYGAAQVYNITFLRNEQLTHYIFPLALRGLSTYGKTFNISLTQYKSCTVSSATPAVVTVTSHGYTTGDKVRFNSSTVPTGMVNGLQYFVNVQGASTFWIYDTQANAIAGGTTGRVNTTSTGSSVVCYKVIEEKVYTLTDVFGNLNKDSNGNQPYIFFHSKDWTTIVDTTATKWSWMASTDDVTLLTNQAGVSLSGCSVWYGTTTQSATTNVDSFCFAKKIDMTAGFTLNGISIMTGYHDQEPFLNPKFVIDPTQGTIGNFRINASSAVMCSSFSSIMIGKNLKFTSTLSSGSTSATLISNFDGVTGTYIVQLLTGTETGTAPQVSMSFTNGSTAVTFSALTEDFLNYAVIAMPFSANFTFTLADASYGININNSAMEHSISIVGEKYYKKTWTTLDAGIVVGASSFVTTGETGWQINDTIGIGGNLVQGVSLADQTTYTITGISTTDGKDTITFSPTLATYDRAKWGAVALLGTTRNSVNFIRLTGTSSQLILASGSFSSLIIASVACNYVSVYITGGSYIPNSYSYAHRCFWLDCWASSPSLFMGFKGTTIRNISATKSESPLSQEITALLADDNYIQDFLFMWQTSGVTSVKQRVKYNNIRMEGKLGSGSQTSNLSTLPSTYFKNVYIWVTNRTSNLVYGVFGAHTGGVIENIYIDGASYALNLGSTPFILYKNVYFGTIVPNLYDITTTGSVTYLDLEFNNIVGAYTYYATNQQFLSGGSRIRITDANGVAGNNRVIQTFGETNITGTGLADTTEHNGNPCIKFTSNYAYDVLEWEQTIPTGNIQNKDMMIGIWCKISNANYWAGTHQMPRLTITYDGASVAYAEAAQSTDWQFLFVPVRPLTTAGSLKAKLTTQSGASGSDTDVYFADYSVLYPAGYTLNLGAFDNYTVGFPTVPTISTSVSALDVWAADPSQFGASTVGDKVNKIKMDTGLIPALL